MIWYKHHDLWLSFYEVLPVQIGSTIWSGHCLAHAMAAVVLCLVIDQWGPFGDDPAAIRDWMSHPSIYFSGYSACLSFLLVYRAQLGYRRYWEARSQIETMTSKCRQVAVHVVTYVQSKDSGAARWKGVQLRRLALFHAVALLELRPCGVDLERLKEGGLATAVEVRLLSRTGCKADLVMTWLVDAWVAREKSGGIDVSAPVLSRTFQLMSDTSLAHDHTHKIADTPFPFPFAQACSLLLLVWCVTLPVMVTIYADVLVLRAALSFIGVLSLFSINGGE
jgi:predicted membrane chloride channel (bestrophin family)